MLYEGDCLEIMPTLPDKSVDMILCDLPHGRTHCEWDVVIPLMPLWTQYMRLIRDHGAIVLPSHQPFTSVLVMSNLKWFKWADVWYKTRSTGHLNCRIMPLRQHQDILIFGKGRITYNPQISIKPDKDIRPFHSKRSQAKCYGTYKSESTRTIPLSNSFPRSVFQINNTNSKEWGLHPTQLPVALCEYLIRTYTSKDDTVLDNCAGSGTTKIAAMNTKRKSILIEKDARYCEIIRKRIKDHNLKLDM